MLDGHTRAHTWNDFRHAVAAAAADVGDWLTGLHKDFLLNLILSRVK